MTDTYPREVRDCLSSWASRRGFMKGASALLGGLTLSPLASRVASAQALTPITIAIAAGLDTSPQFAAIDQGIFEANGLSVTPNIKSSGVELLNSVVAGESLIAIVGMTVTASAVQNGIPLKVIALEHGSPVAKFYSTCRMVAGANRGIVRNNIGSLKGKTIGMPLGTDGEAGALAYLATAGLNKSTVKFVQTAPPDMASALQSGSVDAVAFVEPWLTIVEARVPGSFRIVDEQPPFFSPGVIITSDNTIRDKRAVLIKYLTGVAAGQKWARANLTGELLDVNSRWTQIPREIAAKAIKHITFDTRLSKSVLRGLETNNIPALVSMGVLKQALPMDRIIDTRLQKEVQDTHPELFDDLPAIPKADLL